ncbi:ABC transporter ATP-binding protein [Thermostaphylospora chromogena]|uniref:ABC-2 type transport system ATP-binding protein n=1 Tax=Thermostaphylospora chromogena TaxID=35622 RepID=A0A1H1GHH4_9ACTN|nr:ABC transporter ATP-binding protein [Thermostaphylospora chromogena]SDR12654.1 ABC-2 type transport system ATP-binding protein [Thermostaphylospora chromogena]
MRDRVPARIRALAPAAPAGFALETAGLGVRYRTAWALRDCSLALPAGRIAALVGPNGAGKTTLLHAIAGLLDPAAGSVRTSGDVAFVAQDKPLYERFTVAETLMLGRRLNPRWDASYAEARMAALGIPLRRRVGRLSGGQQAQVALTLALARRPDLLVLDEPLANLDPLARHDVMRAIMAEAAEREVTVLISSHVVSDLEDTCDWLILLNGGRVQVAGDIEDLLDEHLVLSGPAEWAGNLADRTVCVDRAGRQATLLVRGVPAVDPRWHARRATLDELVMGYLRAPRAAALPGPVEVRA